jgi:uncharacterized protein YjbI with pentapeptide repeats
MGKKKHLDVFKQGVEVWNRWREDNPAITPDLSGYNFCKFTVYPYPGGLGGHGISAGYYGHMNLSYAQLAFTNFTHSIFDNANFLGADLGHSNLSYSSLKGVDLRKACLVGTNLGDSDLTGANLSGANIVETKFGNNDLSEVSGLESTNHDGPSSIDFGTIYRSRGNIPREFLFGCGLSESFVVQIPDLIASIEPIQFYSCFISYSSKDQEFTNRLYSDLRRRDVPCWFAAEDLKIGDIFRTRIDHVIRVYDKLLLVLSNNSVSSQWLEKEVETAMEREREQAKTMLFPVRLDDAVNEIKTGWPADVRRTRHIGDFTNWKDRESYEKALDRLFRDLKAESKR